MLKCYCTLVRRNTSQISLIVIPEAGYSQIWILELNQTPWMNGVASPYPKANTPSSLQKTTVAMGRSTAPHMKIHEKNLCHNVLGEHPNRRQNGTQHASKTVSKNLQKWMPKGLRKANPKGPKSDWTGAQPLAHKRHYLPSPWGPRIHSKIGTLTECCFQKKRTKVPRIYLKKNYQGSRNNPKWGPETGSFQGIPRCNNNKSSLPKMGPKPEPKTLIFLSPKPLKKRAPDVTKRELQTSPNVSPRPGRNQRDASRKTTQHATQSHV